MAKISKIDPAEWDAWIAARPAAIREVCRAYPPDRLYLLRTTGHRCTIHGYSEDGTVTVTVSGEFNAIVFARRVFGIKPEDLTECDLPDAREPLGAALTERYDIDAFIKRCREGGRFSVH